VAKEDVYSRAKALDGFFLVEPIGETSESMQPYSAVACCAASIRKMSGRVVLVSIDLPMRSVGKGALLAGRIRVSVPATASASVWSGKPKKSRRLIGLEN
jgi:hypothetical protein